MRLLLIRHGEPDNARNTLTERGWKEAKILAARLAPMDIKDIYVSPLGRAMDTASCTLKAMGRPAAEICDWLQEFPAEVDFRQNPDLQNAFSEAEILRRKDGSAYRNICWDLYPDYWTKQEAYYGKQDWRKSELCAGSDIEAVYDHVTENFDRILAAHGYLRSGNLYQVKKANTDTLAFFCHFGMTCVLLSHLLGISPFPLWHGMAFAPSSVTTLYTEERKKGIASFRAAQLGDISHLYAAGVEPSFSARFCEIYDDFSQRH